MADFDLTSLKDYLASKLGVKDLSIERVWKNIEGWSMQTYSLKLTYDQNGKMMEKEIVIRREPESGLLEPYDASVEYRVLSALFGTEVAVPRTLWYEPDSRVMGKPFYVMEKVEGEVHKWSLSRAAMDPNYRVIPDDAERASLARDFVKNIAAIHRINWQALGLGFLGDPGSGVGSALAQVNYWEEVIARAGFRNKPIVAYAVNWLKSNLVTNEKVCLVHGDYRTGNFIARNGRIVAVLDWEMVHLGDPMEDISYIIGSAWRSARPFSWVSHLLPQEEFFSRYEEASGIKINRERLKFYHILNDFKALGIAVTAANAFSNKFNPDLRVGVFALTHYASSFNIIRALNKYLGV